jgi:hypothetical protein
MVDIAYLHVAIGNCINSRSEKAFINCKEFDSKKYIIFGRKKVKGIRKKKFENMLKINKKASGRHKDLADVEQLKLS